MDTIGYGKVPPNAMEIESAVLGALLIEKDKLYIVSEILKPESFYSDANKKIFSSILSLSSKNMPIDLLTVVEELRLKEHLDLVGGPFYLTKLTNSVVSSAHIEAHSRVIQQKFFLREIIRKSGNMLVQAYEDLTDVFDLLDFAEKEILSINTQSKGDYNKLNKGLLKAISFIDQLRHSEKELTGIPSGFREIDKLTCGWQPTDLIILAARPSVGKSAFMLNLALNAAKAGYNAGIFSMEMQETQLIYRLLSTESQIPLEKITRGKLSDSEFEDLQKLGATPLFDKEIFLDETPGLNIYQLRNKCRRMVQKDKVKIIFIDYLQLMSGIQNGRADNREQEIEKISRDLKGLSKELNVPIIALSQLSRDVEKRTGKKMPQLSDLRNSGALEQDADVVIFMYRPEYNGIHHGEDGENITGQTEFKFAKHRQGALETVTLMADLKIQKFTDYVKAPRQKGLSKPEQATGFVPFVNKEDETYKFD